MTRTFQMYQRHEAERARQRVEYDKVVQDEFPPGTRVTWIHSFKIEGSKRIPLYLNGRVMEYRRNRVFIERHTGTVFEVEPHRLELVSA